MNPTHVEQEVIPEQIQPGAFLALEREKRDITIEQIASKLNLRVQVIKHLEADEYLDLPQAVFVQGYIRAYCKFLGISPDPVIEAYSRVKPNELRQEKGLWQNEKQHFKNDRWLHWGTSFFVILAVGLASTWLYENNKTDSIVPNQWRQATQVVTQAKVMPAKKEVKVISPHKPTEVEVSDLSKMRELLTSPSENSNFSPKEME